MTKYNLKDAFIYMTKEEAQKRGTREDIYIVNESSAAHDEILDIVHEIRDEGADTDLAYEIVAKACDMIDEGTDEDFDSAASIYTNERLSYLNSSNMDDITRFVKDEGCSDIGEACAYWYDGRVQDAIRSIREKIEEGESSL